MALDTPALGLIETMILRRIVYWALWIIVAVFVYKAALWAYQGVKAGEQAQQQEELHDVDKICRVIPDTGQCVCRHRETDQRIFLPYDECVSRAKLR
jgi:hypothetical protein